MTCNRGEGRIGSKKQDLTIGPYIFSLQATGTEYEVSQVNTRMATRQKEVDERIHLIGQRALACYQQNHEVDSTKKAGT